jgi:signal transduction histidine kinase
MKHPAHARVEAALQQERDLYKDLMNSQPAGMYRLRVRDDSGWRKENWRTRLDATYTVEMVSDRFVEISGISKAAFEANPGIVPDSVHPEDAAGFVLKNVEALETLTPFVWEGRIVKNGAPLWVHMESIPRRFGNGDLIWTGILYDISDRRTMEEETLRLNASLEAQVEERTKELSIANRELEAANKDLESFSYSVAHDLRAPLRAIDGFTSILRNDYAPLLDAEGLRITAAICDNTMKMSRLIDDLLAFSRTGRASINRSEVDMEALARSVFLELTAARDRGRIDLNVGTLAAAWGDPTLLRQVWTNLLANAIKFSSKKERAEISVDSRRQAGEIVYSVRDNGAGFDMHYMDKLFGVFQRLHSQAEFEGTGVGLAIVASIVHRHGGKVWAEGKVDEGATFYFTLGFQGERP